MFPWSLASVAGLRIAQLAVFFRQLLDAHDELAI